MKLRPAPAALPLLVLVLWGCGKPAATTTAVADNSYPVEVITAATRPLTATVTAPGRIEAAELVQVAAMVPGTVTAVPVREGERIAAGATIALIDPAHFAIAVEQAQAQERAAVAQESEARADLARAEELAKTPGLIRPDQLDQARARAAQAAAGRDRAVADRKAAELDLTRATATAPCAGTILARPAQQGMWAQPGAPLATILPDGNLRLRASVPAAEAALLAVGLSLSFVAEGDEIVRAGNITSVAAAADPQTRQVEVLAEPVPGAGTGLRANTFTRITVPVEAERSVVVLPDLAVRPGERGFYAFTIVEGDDGPRAQERKLVLGQRTADGVEVRSGLQAGDRVAVRGAEALRDGVRVRVLAAEAKP